MKTIKFLLFLLCFCMSCQHKKAVSEKSVQGAPNSFIPLFNGQTFEGWEGDTTFFRIEEEAIVAGTLKQNIPENQFLCTRKDFANFELQLAVKFVTKDNNGGIQFRSKRIPNHHEVIGYQCDVGYAGGKTVWGGIYDESRRNRFLVPVPEAPVAKVLREDTYNQYRIKCEGPKIQFWLNETQILDYTESNDSIATSGIICVQIHSGKPAEAWYKDMEIREL